MALSLEQLTAAFKKEETNESRPSNYYCFWNMEEGETAVVRFLPDADPDNNFGFMAEKLMHNLEINGERKSIPCLKMYGEDCPICKVSSAYYKDEGKGSVNGKKYWRNKQHILQALIVTDPLPANVETGENAEGKVMFLNFGYQLYSVIKEAFESGDALDDVPYLFEGGTDFIIKKTVSGDGRPKYDVGSKFARRPSDLTPDQIEAAEDGMVCLSTLIPPNPGLEKVEAMLEAALTGGQYKEDDFTPSTLATEPQATKPTVAEKPIVDEKPVGTDEFADESQDILAQIRQRKSKSVG